MKRFWIIICAAVLSPVAWGQAAPISGQVLNQYGSPVAGAQVYICNAATSTGLPCTPTASIYYDYNLQNIAPNPYSTDANGNFSVYVPPLAFPNTYVVNAVPQSGTTYTWLYPGPSCSLSGCTFTGNVTAPLFNATLSPYYEINGIQISSSALSDASNLAKLNAANNFTGTPQTAPVFNATTGFDVNGVPLASTNLSDSSNLARLNASNAFTGSLNTFQGVQGTTINATSGYQVSGVALAASNLSNGVSGTGQVCLSSGSACYTGGTVTSVSASSTTLSVSGGPITGVGTFTINLSSVGTAGTYAYPASMTTDTYGRVTSVTAGPSSLGQTQCLSSSCAGGSTYVSGTTYTNNFAYSVLEEVTMQYETYTAQGCEYELISLANSLLVGNNGVHNDCGGAATNTFKVAPGATFSSTVTHVAGGTSGFVITSWVETPAI